MTSYRLFLLRSAWGRWVRAAAYHGVSSRAQLRTWRASYPVQLAGYRVRRAASATGRALVRVPGAAFAALNLVAWFFRQLPPYVTRVAADWREDRDELRAERRLVAAQRREQKAQRQADRLVWTAARRDRRSTRRRDTAERRQRRKAELTAIRSARGERPYALPVPMWMARLAGPPRAGERGAARLPVPRRVLVAAAVTVAAAVPAYALVSSAFDSGPAVRSAAPNTANPRAALPNAALPNAANPNGALSNATSPVPPVPGAPAPAVAAAVTAPGTRGPAAGTVTGRTGDFVAALPAVPPAVPVIPGARTDAVAPAPSRRGDGSAPATPATPVTSAAPAAPATARPAPLSLHQRREARRLAHYQKRAAEQAAKYNQDAGK